MFANLIDAIEPFVHAYGAVGVFVVSFIEEIVAPIPSLLSFMAAGFFLLPAQASVGTIISEAFLYVALPAGLGLTSGAFFIYAALYFGGEPLIHRWGHYVGLSWEKLKKVEAHLARHKADEWLLFGMRVVPFVPNVAISAVCGVLRYPLRVFLVLTFLGGMLRAFFVGLVGWSVGAAYASYADQLSRAGSVAGIVLFVLLLVSLGHLVRKRRSL